ncbi:putative membrane protein [Erwinia phage pEa_SNUABM_50]|uniref:Uncharacterized protein n=4 Tax=Eneladusvirus BF TaxID=2560751 RepID=A0A1S6UAD6_9CAUD|nr:hypothetical protein FDH34_gp109 [Serratia phage BF]QOI71047.1 putative membrane protein [Erwinia phage pEa_SNUABM_12]QOI71592.1 putative membrane protein [Erwinia phage pEa_SNUABM_47]QOI72131.1 putative membrane protein [Erwinia phage pEa_SNUABM_50]QXO11256.1 hypothetical protein pEaSNUABM19_00110 [Erwinia phage pEa_SNUABM_19]QXO11804.1 hypothetical protein pEaSNUABM44_00108 [Erwinia phage pEa_SNUABM_44]QXO12356.1 hypothetical protein pEaSNUABM49_00110 [Erwinia phage pEa_SNUABM_49]
MNIFMAVLSIFCYIFIGYLAYHDHREKFKEEPNKKVKKVLYATTAITLYVLIGFFLAVLLYLILTM